METGPAVAVPAVSVLGLVAAAVSSTLTGAAGGAVEVACCSGHSAMTGGAAVAAAAALCSAVPGHRPKSRPVSLVSEKNQRV